MSQRKKNGKKDTKKETLAKIKINSNKRYLMAIVGLVLTIAVAVMFIINLGNNQLSKKEKLRKEWFAAMEQIVSRTKNPTAVQVLNFMKDNYVLAMPLENQGNSFEYNMYRDGQVVNGNELPKNYFLFVIVDPGESIPQTERSLKNFTIYNPQFRSIFISSDRHNTDSDFNVGFTLLHEGFHAYDHYKSGYRLNRNWDDMLENERQVYLFETQLMVTYLGYRAEAFTTRMAQAIKIGLRRSEADNKKLELTIDDSFNREPYWAELSTFIWPIKHPNELARITEFLKLYAEFKKVQTIYPDLNPHDLVTVQKIIVAKHNGLQDKIAQIKN